MIAAGEKVRPDIWTGVFPNMSLCQTLQHADDEASERLMLMHDLFDGSECKWW